MTKARILVVDDEASARGGLEKLLEQSGYDVATAADGALALEIASERAPDVVVTDLKMPNMDGMTLLAKLREQDNELPVIVTTAFGDVDAAVDAMRKGAAVKVRKRGQRDAPFRTRRARGAAERLASAHGVPFRLLECVAPADVCRARLVARDRKVSVSDARPDIYEAFAAGYEPIGELPPTEHFRIDTSTDSYQSLMEAKREIETWPRGLVQ